MTISKKYVTFIQPFNEEIMTIQKFKRGDVVTLVTNHYNNDKGDFYKEYDFARIIDIKDNYNHLVDPIVENVYINTNSLLEGMSSLVDKYKSDSEILVAGIPRPVTTPPIVVLEDVTNG